MYADALDGLQIASLVGFINDSPEGIGDLNEQSVGINHLEAEGAPM